MKIDGYKFSEFLDSLIDKAEANVQDYEEFHGPQLANIPDMNPMDSFLYGVGNGKLEQLKYLKLLVDEAIKQKQDEWAL